MGYDYRKRPQNVDERSRIRGAAISTAASTALEPNQIVALQSTSTAAAVVYTIRDGVKAGDVLEIGVHMVGSATGGPFHINAQSSGAFGYAPATTAQNMLSMGTIGSGVRLVALNSSEWFVCGDATLSTST